jgi:hypothetical protein
MPANSDSNPEDEYADDQYADYDAEDLEEPPAAPGIPDDEPEADVLEQRQEVPYYTDDEEAPLADEDVYDEEDED